MSDYKTVPTTSDVWTAIKRAHPELRVFSSYSAPCGDAFISRRGEMFTAYGFPSHDYPIMQAETTWEIDPEMPSNRINEQHRYWLCVANQQAE